MEGSEGSKITKRMEETKLLSKSCIPYEDKEETKRSQLHVTFLLPKSDLRSLEQPNDNNNNNTISKELFTQLPTLPSICEFTIFSPNNQVMPKAEKEMSKLPPVCTKNSKLVRTSQKGLVSTHQRKIRPVDNQRTVRCTRQDLRMETKSKLPEEYKEPTYKDTKKRIWDWLRQSEEQKPSYLRRASVFKKTKRLERGNTHYSYPSEKTESLTQRLIL